MAQLGAYGVCSVSSIREFLAITFLDLAADVFSHDQLSLLNVNILFDLAVDRMKRP